MPHRRSLEGCKHQIERWAKFEQSKPRFEVSSTFTAKQIHVVAVTNDNGLVMKHQRKAVGLCVHCGSTENLNVHHIDQNHDNNLLDNLLVLCAKCHKKEHLEINKNAVQS